LPVLEQFHVLQEMRSLETLIVGQRGKADDLQFFELRGVLRARVSDHETISEFAVIPAHNNLYRGKLGLRFRPKPRIVEKQSAGQGQNQSQGQNHFQLK
jgi:hypothetical protein